MDSISGPGPNWHIPNFSSSGSETQKQCAQDVMTLSMTLEAILNENGISVPSKYLNNLESAFNTYVNNPNPNTGLEFSSAAVNFYNTVTNLIGQQSHAHPNLTKELTSLNDALFEGILRFMKQSDDTKGIESLKSPLS